MSNGWSSFDNQKANEFGWGIYWSGRYGFHIEVSDNGIGKLINDFDALLLLARMIKNGDDIAVKAFSFLKSSGSPDYLVLERVLEEGKFV